MVPYQIVDKILAELNNFEKHGLIGHVVIEVSISKQGAAHIILLPSFNCNQIGSNVIFIN